LGRTIFSFDGPDGVGSVRTQRRCRIASFLIT
jgi:hypothetical protein